jgi:hypothetical protein
MRLAPGATRRSLERAQQARPSFFIVGAPKCGTSALTTYLKRHPDIFLTEMWEPMFFGSDLYCPPGRRLTLDEYLALFASVEGERQTGECSTRYFVSKRAPEEIRRFEPAARIIVMLRDPVEMMHSLHAQLLYSGEERKRDFEAALEDEPRRRELIEQGDPPPIPQVLAYRYVARYAEHVERYFSVFGRDRVHVIVFEDFVRDTGGAYGQVLEFLGARPDRTQSFEVVNRYRAMRSWRLHDFLVRRIRPVRTLARVHPARLQHGLYSWARELNTRKGKRPAVPAALRRRLEAELAAEIERLERLLGRDLSHWRGQVARRA